MSQEYQIILSLDELVRAVQLKPDVIIELVELQILEPIGDAKANWQFDALCLKRAKVASNLHLDLEVNLCGVALAIELMERIDNLESQVNTLQRLLED